MKWIEQKRAGASPRLFVRPCWLCFGRDKASGIRAADDHPTSFSPPLSRQISRYLLFISLNLLSLPPLIIDIMESLRQRATAAKVALSSREGLINGNSD